jgi:rubrerythrin
MPDDRLTAAERVRIGSSLATFQLGERSEGHTLRRLAQRHAAKHDCPDLVPITECFIREEQRHAATLAGYMRDHGLPLREREATDRVFRGLRRLAGFELAVAVLVTAELMGIQFYRALLRSTGSRRLRAICTTFLQDEALHVAYESELLLALRARRGRWLGGALAVAHLAFHVATALVVWIAHHRVLRAAGHSAWEFPRTCARHYALYLWPPRSGPRLVARVVGRGSQPIAADAGRDAARAWAARRPMQRRPPQR